MENLVQGSPVTSGPLPTGTVVERSKLPDVNPTTNLNFGQAIQAAKDGKRVCRTGWNGKSMFLYHVPANSYPAVTEQAKAYFGETVPYGAYIAMKTAQENVVPWLASQTDILAEDWEILD
jgi:hypothetical protein